MNFQPAKPLRAYFIILAFVCGPTALAETSQSTDVASILGVKNKALMNAVKAGARRPATWNPKPALQASVQPSSRFLLNAADVAEDDSLLANEKNKQLEAEIKQEVEAQRQQFRQEIEIVMQKMLAFEPAVRKREKDLIRSGLLKESTKPQATARPKVFKKPATPHERLLQVVQPQTVTLENQNIANAEEARTAAPLLK